MSEQLDRFKQRVDNARMNTAHKGAMDNPITKELREMFTGNECEFSEVATGDMHSMDTAFHYMLNPHKSDVPEAAARQRDEWYKTTLQRYTDEELLAEMVRRGREKFSQL